MTPDAPARADMLDVARRRAALATFDVRRDIDGTPADVARNRGKRALVGWPPPPRPSGPGGDAG